MKKRMAVLALFSMIFLTTAYAIPASAVTVDPMTSRKSISGKIVLPKWESTDMVIPSISVSGTQLSVSVLISPKKPTTTTTGTLYLEKKVGNAWTEVASWPIDGTGTVSITKNYRGTKGVTYHTRVVVTTGADDIDLVSTERTV